MTADSGLVVIASTARTIVLGAASERAVSVTHCTAASVGDSAFDFSTG
ncbi:MAG TPA: hypothetical protein VFX13_11105 [Gaiellales bacterium]|nr:hypothetical protein [Gaiellales bacterium]